MNDSKFLKILYTIICVILCAFFGFGVYFVMQDVYGAGLIAIGIGLIGLGFALFLGTGLVFAVDDGVTVTRSSQPIGRAVLSGKALMKNVTSTAQAVCNCRWLQDADVDVSITDVGFYVQVEDEEPIYIRFADIMRVAHVNNQFLIMGEFEYQMKFGQEAMTLTMDNKIKCKTFEKLLLSAGVEFASEDIAESVIAEIQSSIVEKQKVPTATVTTRRTIKNNK